MPQTGPLVLLWLQPLFASQRSMVQGLPSSQSSVVLAPQTPAVMQSVWPQALVRITLTLAACFGSVWMMVARMMPPSLRPNNDDRCETEGPKSRSHCQVPEKSALPRKASKPSVLAL